MKRWLHALFILLGFVAVFGFAVSASAHRSGCHRWHSCPSDTGSYVCGDLGYTSGCGYSYARPVYTPSRAKTSPKKAIPFSLTKKLSSYTCSSNVYNCSNFRTEKQAQSVFNYCKKQTGKRDVHKLDSDKDGKACETLK